MPLTPKVEDLVEDLKSEANCLSYDDDTSGLASPMGPINMQKFKKKKTIPAASIPFEIKKKQ